MTQYVRATHTAKLAKESLYGQDTGSRPNQHWGGFSVRITHTHNHIEVVKWIDGGSYWMKWKSSIILPSVREVQYLCLWSVAYSLFTVIGWENGVVCPLPNLRASCLASFLQRSFIVWKTVSSLLPFSVLPWHRPWKGASHLGRSANVCLVVVAYISSCLICVAWRGWAVCVWACICVREVCVKWCGPWLIGMSYFINSHRKL